LKLNNNINWLQLKQEYVEKLSTIYDSSEANNILQILGEELLPHYNKFELKNAALTITNEEAALIKKAYLRLQKSEPLHYVLGKAWFYDLELKVNQHVLIPRPETEELVDLIIKDYPNFEGSILDIGTGSGCIPLTLKKHLPKAEINAVDVDENALNVAKENSENLNLKVNFQLVDILNEAARNSLGKFDVIVSNPPYIPFVEKEKMQKNVLAFEPHLALFVENDNALLFYNTIAKFALTHLKPNGKLYFECNEYNAQEVVKMLIANQFENVQIFKDLQGKNRMVSAIHSTKINS